MLTRIALNTFFLSEVSYKRGRWLKGSQSDQKKKLKAFTAEFAENAEKAHFKLSLRSSAVSAVKNYNVSHESLGLPGSGFRPQGCNPPNS